MYVLHFNFVIFSYILVLEKIGSAYSKDAYVQNELVISALKTATDHLREGGTFCTKIYRSIDYNAIIWALQQVADIIICWLSKHRQNSKRH